mmetsp:Transcript_25374/g.45801  ORF Transcript_25374/g.45801 Transcript_25374/m.45801 type:complete len:80 (-) Transcript_25374:371-610(-)
MMNVKIWRKRDKRLEENVRVKLTSSQNLERGGWHCIISEESVVEFNWIQNPEARGGEINKIVHRGNVSEKPMGVLDFVK